MNDKLIKAIEKLKSLGIKYNVLEFNEAARTSEDVARLYKINPREIIKTLIIKTNDNRVFAVMVPGPMKIDNKKLLKEIKTKSVRFLNEDEMRTNTIFQPGEVCPVLIENMTILIDKTVFETEKINFGSGDLFYGIEINSKDLLKIVKNEKIVDVVKN